MACAWNIAIIQRRMLTRPALLLLHEGLGCVAMWRHFPEKLAAATGCRVIVWSRAGYGASDPYPEPRTPRYMHREALEALPALIAALHIERPLLVGHSDGGSIALIFAGAFPEQTCGVVAMAPHEFVEEETLAGILAAKTAWTVTDWPQKLARYHRDAPRCSADWNDTWLSPDFRDWNIEEYLPQSVARCWRCKAKTTNTPPCARSKSSPNRCRELNCSNWPTAATRRSAIRKRGAGCDFPDSVSRLTNP